MYTAYFDASGHEGRDGKSHSEFLVVAGFVAAANHWIEFNKRWNDRLFSAGINMFHATEHRDKKLREKLVEIIQSSGALPFSCAVEIPALHGMSPDLRGRYHLRAYALGGRACAGRLLKWAKSFHSRYAPEMFFEDGDAGKEALEERLLRDKFPRPQFKPKKDRTTREGLLEKGLLPFQAADFLANEIFNACLSGDATSWEMEAFLKMQGGYLGGCSVEEIEDFEKNLRIVDLTRYLGALTK